MLQRGYDSTSGTAAKSFEVAADDGLVLRMLKSTGAIPIARTNVPQLLMLPESSNNVFGITRVCKPRLCIWDTSPRLRAGVRRGTGGVQFMIRPMLVVQNPWNVKRTPGGSSGGEGAIIAAQGAPLGFGTDIGE